MNLNLKECGIDEYISQAECNVYTESWKNGGSLVHLLLDINQKFIMKQLYKTFVSL